jgi:hypothetical protein
VGRSRELTDVQKHSAPVLEPGTPGIGYAPKSLAVQTEKAVLRQSKSHIIMQTCILRFTSALALWGAAATLRADVMISNLSQPGQPQAYGPGLSAGTIFFTGLERSKVNSVTLVHWYYDPANPPQHFQVQIYQPIYGPGDPAPTMQLVGELGNPIVGPTPMVWLLGPPTLVAYSPATDLILEPSTMYAVIIGEALGGSVEAAVQFTSSLSYDAVEKWSLGGDLIGLDLGTDQIWWSNAGHLAFDLDASPAPELNRPPDISQAHASVAVLWPPNGRMVPFQIEGVTDPDGDAVSVSITRIQQNEPPALGKQGPDAVIDGTGTAAVRATRLGSGNGRVYKVFFVTNDGKPGGAVSGVVYISVPHDQGSPVAVDDDTVSGYFDSTAR